MRYVVFCLIYLYSHWLVLKLMMCENIVWFLLQKSYHYIALLKTIMRLSLTNMKAADVKDVASSITTIANEKLKAEKEAAAGKKKGIILNVLLTITSSLVYSFMNVLF